MATEIRELLDEGAARLGRVADDPRHEAEILLGAALGRTRAFLLAHPEQRILDCEATDRYESNVTRRAQGEPVAYILGEKEFWSLPLAVGPGVLDPATRDRVAGRACAGASPGRSLLRRTRSGHRQRCRGACDRDGATARAGRRDRRLERGAGRGAAQRGAPVARVTHRVRRGLVVRAPVATHVRRHRQQPALHRGGRPARGTCGAPF